MTTYGEMIGIIFAHLQEAFGSSRWMFWALRAGQKGEDVTEWKKKDPPQKINSKQSKSVHRCCRISSVLSPFPPSRVAAAGRCRCCGPTWPGLSWWTGLWCTGLCYENLQTGLPRGWEHLDWPWQNPARNLKSVIVTQSSKLIMRTRRSDA